MTASSRTAVVIALRLGVVRQKEDALQVAHVGVARGVDADGSQDLGVANAEFFLGHVGSRDGVPDAGEIAVAGVFFDLLAIGLEVAFFGDVVQQSGGQRGRGVYTVAHGEGQRGVGDAQGVEVPLGRQPVAQLIDDTIHMFRACPVGVHTPIAFYRRP